MTGRHQNFTDDFRREAVRLSAESGRTVGDVADDLGIGKSTLISWRRRFADEALFSGPHDDLETENARLRKENDTLRQERDLLKKQQFTDRQVIAQQIPRGFFPTETKR